MVKKFFWGITQSRKETSIAMFLRCNDLYAIKLWNA